MAGSTDQYKIEFSKGVESLSLHKDVQLPVLEANDCLVKVEAVSLNYRDIAMAIGAYPNPVGESGVIPCSDATGTVVEVGSGVTQFKVGDRVCNTFFRDYESGLITPEARMTSLGAVRDGVLARKLVVPETGLVAAPKSLSAVENSTLPCAALTAWNSLFGLEGRQLKAGECVLTQGTGGVSMFAIQFALAVGATVIATTSSESKAQKLRDMGVKNVINYKEDENWGETAKKLSPGGLGAHHILEVGGEKTLLQSFKAVRLEGLISIIGFLGGRDDKNPLSYWETFKTVTVVRGVNVGSRQQFKEMNAFIEEKKIKPVVDEKVFAFEDAKEAYRALEAQKFFGKVVIKVE
jgi:NADPH:quinone reductase-like Zn-dependent oxidoreductase